MMRMLRHLTVLLVVLDVAMPGTANAAPRVTVQARTEVVLEPLRRQADGVLVRAQLLDRLTRAPVAAAPVRITVDGQSQEHRTDRDGRVDGIFAIGERSELRVEFAGDAHYSAASVQLSEVDVAKEPLELSVEVGDVALSAPTFEVIVRAGTDVAGAAIAVELWADDGAERARLGTLVTDTTGRGVQQVATALLDAPGRKRVIARFAGSDAFNPAEAATPLLLTTTTELAMAVAPAEIAFEGRLATRGRLIDARGDGLSSAVIAVVADQRRLGEAITDDRGHWTFTVPAAEVGTGRWHVQAHFEPLLPWHRASRSGPVALRVAEPAPVPVGYTIAAFAATALALLAFVLLRLRPWRRLRRPRPASVAARPPSQAAPTPAFIPAQPRFIAGMRQPHEERFTGTVHDATTGAPVPDAALELRGPGETIVLSCDGAARFASPPLAAGSFTVRAWAAGYVTHEFTIALPHRGELTEARIELVAIREQIFSCYRAAALPLIPRSELWGIWTPRQIFEHVRQQRPAGALRHLTDFVEEAYFSPRAPDEAALNEALGRIERARHEQAGSSGAD